MYCKAPKVEISPAYVTQCIKRILRSPTPEQELEDIKESFMNTENTAAYTEIVRQYNLLKLRNLNVKNVSAIAPVTHVNIPIK